MVAKTAVVEAMEHRFDYWSARYVLADAATAAGFGDKDEYSEAEIAAIAEALPGIAERVGDVVSKLSELSGDAASAVIEEPAPVEEAVVEEAVVEEAVVEEAVVEEAVVEETAAEETAAEEAVVEEAVVEEAVVEEAVVEEAAPKAKRKGRKKSKKK